MINRERLRIVHTESSWGWGGQEIRILTESRGMIERGHDVKIVCTPDAEIFKRAADYGVPAEAISIQKKNFKGLNAIRSWLQKNDVDVINTHSSIDSWLVSVATRTGTRRPRIVRTRHVGLPAPNNIASNWIYRRGADFIVTCGNAIVKGLNQRNGVKLDRMRSIPTGIDTERFIPGDKDQARKKLNLPTDRKIVGIVSALRREKGHQYLCEAVARLSRTDFDLLIVGDGLSRDVVEKIVKENKLEDRVHLAGNQKDVVPWLQSMDLFVLPSFGAVEGVPQSIMQAMSCKLPVISTTVGSISQAVEHETTGLLVPPKDADSLSKAINKLLDETTLAEKFAEAGFRKAQAEFPISCMLDRMEEVFYQLYNSTHAKAA